MSPVSRASRPLAVELCYGKPCRPSKAKKPPTGPGWLHEIKFDGYRLRVARDGDKVRLVTKSGTSWPGRYPALRNAVAQLKAANSFLIDGEVVVGTQAGHADFNALRYGFQRTKPVVLVAFDLLSLDGQDLRLLPLIERKALLEKLVKGKGASELIVLAPYVIDEDGPLVFESACEIGCEGIVSKKLTAPYDSGLSRAWIKVKNPASTTVKREADEDWNRAGKHRRR